MPNIIEQQDLLKGLPDNRLAMLLQNPVADIPPFLVAAEAQRRQAIRQQFQASAPQESVVDSLTKQLANVPQNIQAPAQQPPRMPQMAQTPQAQGVMALQQQPQQQAQQQQAQPQQMRMGGMVRRYAAGGPAGSIYGPAPEGGAEQIARTYMFLNPGMTYEEALQRAGIGQPLARPTVQQIAEARSGKALTGMGGVGNYSVLRDSTAVASDEPSVEEPAEPDIFADMGIAGVPGGVTRAGKVLPRKIDSGKDDGSKDNEDKPDVKPLAGETPDEYRARLEELMKAREPSDWEKAQRWFEMAGQFFDPSKTMGESIAGAGQAFAQSSAELDRARRLSEFEYQKAMLEYDMGKSDEERAAAAEAAKDAREFKQRMLERGTPSADATITSIDRSIRQIDEDILKLSKPLIEGMPVSPENPIPPENQEKIKALMKRRSDLNKIMIGIMDKGGFVNKNLVTQEELDSLGPL